MHFSSRQHRSSSTLLEQMMRRGIWQCNGTVWLYYSSRRRVDGLSCLFPLLARSGSHSLWLIRRRASQSQANHWSLVSTRCTVLWSFSCCYSLPWSVQLTGETYLLFILTPTVLLLNSHNSRAVHSSRCPFDWWLSTDVTHQSPPSSAWAGWYNHLLLLLPLWYITTR